MPDNTVYLITGANRGIGLALTTHLLSRPHTTVIATSRRLPVPAFDSLTSSLPNGSGSKLVPLLLDESNPSIASSTLAARLREQQPGIISKIDVVIANAGAASGIKDVLGTTEEEMLRDFEVNALGPVRVFRAVWEGGLFPGEGEKKFVLMTSSIGSIGTLETESLPGIGYGMSKAAVNWWAKKASIELKDKGLLVGIIHPGWVKTDLGQGLADAIGFKEPPMTLEQSAEAVVERIDNLTPETSGQYLKYDGQQLPW